MSRNLDNDFKIELEGKEYFPVCLVQFSDGSNTYRYTTLDVSMIYQTNKFESRGFQFESIKYSLGNVVDSATIVFDNHDQAMTSIFVDGVIQNNLAILYIAVLDSDGNVISVCNIFEGQADSWSLDEREIRLVVSTDFARWAQKSISYHSSSCRWRVFKGDKCQYSGAESQCDRSYKRCLALGNEDNFGGFRWLPDFINRELFWGPTTEKIEE